MMLVAARATRWVADEPFPGLVEIELTDSDGRAHRFTEKCSVVDDADRLRPDADYPIDVTLACRPRRRGFRRGANPMPQGIDLSPWGIGDPDTTYTVERSSLTWAEPALYSDLSIRARQAVAVATFRRWRETVGLRSTDLETLEEHLASFATVGPDTFNAWFEAHPLTVRDPGDPLPPSLLCAASQKVDAVRLTEAIDALVGITYDGMFGSPDSLPSLAALDVVGRFTAADGVQLAAPDASAGGLWVDGPWGHRRHVQDPGQERA